MTLRRTKLRHLLLAEVAADNRSIYEGLQWTVIHRDGRWCSAAEVRTGRDLKPFIKGRRSTYASNLMEADLTPEGAALLAEWNTKYGNPLDEDSREGREGDAPWMIG
jgi:hypothetical protein